MGMEVNNENVSIFTSLFSVTPRLSAIYVLAAYRLERRRSRHKAGRAIISGVMPALVAGIHALLNIRMQGGFVYMMTNKRNGILYVGVTSNLVRRVYEHREGLVEGFTKRYGLKRLVYYERHDDMRHAIQREKTIKHWSRAWKVRTVHGFNPDWDDLFDAIS
jgi:putative endonuclease